MADQQDLQANKDFIANRFAALTGKTALDTAEKMAKKELGKEAPSFIDELTSTEGILKGLMAIGAGVATGSPELGGLLGLKAAQGAARRGKAGEDQLEVEQDTAIAAFGTEQNLAAQRNQNFFNSNPDLYTAGFESIVDLDERNAAVQDSLGLGGEDGYVRDYVGSVKRNKQIAANKAQGQFIIANINTIEDPELRTQMVMQAHTLMGMAVDPNNVEYYRQLGTREYTFDDLMKMFPRADGPSWLAAMKLAPGANLDDPAVLMEIIDKVQLVNPVTGGTGNQTSLDMSRESDIEAKIYERYDRELLKGTNYTRDEIIAMALTPRERGDLIRIKGLRGDEARAFGMEDFITPGERLNNQKILGDMIAQTSMLEYMVGKPVMENGKYVLDDDGKQIPMTTEMAMAQLSRGLTASTIEANFRIQRGTMGTLAAFQVDRALGSYPKEETAAWTPDQRVFMREQTQRQLSDVRRNFLMPYTIVDGEPVQKSAAAQEAIAGFRNGGPEFQGEMIRQMWTATYGPGTTPVEEPIADPVVGEDGGILTPAELALRDAPPLVLPTAAEILPAGEYSDDPEIRKAQETIVKDAEKEAKRQHRLAVSEQERELRGAVRAEAEQAKANKAATEDATEARQQGMDSETWWAQIDHTNPKSEFIDRMRFVYDAPNVAAKAEKIYPKLVAWAAAQNIQPGTEEFSEAMLERLNKYYTSFARFM